MKDSSDTHPNHLPDSSYGLFIDNQWVSDKYGEALDIINATAADVARAVQGAQRAFVTWTARALLTSLIHVFLTYNIEYFRYAGKRNVTIRTFQNHSAGPIHP